MPGLFGGGGGATTSTNYTSSLPEYAEPYFRTLMNQAENVYQDRASNYNPYTQERIAAPSWQENASRQGAEEMYLNPDKRWEDYSRGQLNNASAISGQIDKINNQYNPDLSGQGAVPGQISYGGPFSANKAAYYMNPYNDAVTRSAVTAANSRYEGQRDQRAAQMAAQGARGGYRGAVMDAIAQGENQRNIGDIVAASGQRGWENAQQQYERDRQAMMGAGQFNVGSAMQGWKNRDDAARAAGLMGINAGNMNAQNLLQLQSQMQGLAETGAQTGALSQQQEIQRQARMENAGQAERSDAQNKMDMNYTDFIRQRDWVPNQLQQWMGLMSGVPVNPNTSATQYSGSPNWASQLAGAGLGIAGLSNFFGE